MAGNTLLFTGSKALKAEGEHVSPFVLLATGVGWCVPGLGKVGGLLNPPPLRCLELFMT